MPQARKIRYAVVGAGNIAQEAILPAFAHAEDNSELVALVSSNPEKRAALREKYSLEADGDYSEFDSVLERARVDAVYVATPNALHRGYTLRAASAGRHVLCEKPVAATTAEAREMSEAGKRAGKSTDDTTTVILRFPCKEASDRQRAEPFRQIARRLVGSR